MRESKGSATQEFVNLIALRGRIDRDGRTALAVVEVADAWPRVVAVAGADYAWTAISPDRSLLAFTLFHHDDLNCTTLHVVPLAGGDNLVVGRGGTVPPWGEGEPLQLDSRPSDPLGDAPNVIGGGPLLLQDTEASVRLLRLFLVGHQCLPIWHLPFFS